MFVSAKFKIFKHAYYLRKHKHSCNVYVYKLFSEIKRPLLSNLVIGFLKRDTKTTSDFRGYYFNCAVFVFRWSNYIVNRFV